MKFILDNLSSNYLNTSNGLICSLMDVVPRAEEDVGEDWCCPYEYGRSARKRHARENPGIRFRSKDYGIGQPRNATECVKGCRRKFIREVAPEAFIEREIELVTLCRTLLSGDNSSQIFWPLYCCDHNPCGVWVYPERGPGQDRETTLVIFFKLYVALANTYPHSEC